MNNGKLMREAERYLKRLEPYQENRRNDDDENYKIDYVLLWESAGKTDIKAFAGLEGQILQFDPADKNENAYIENWAFNFDDDLFGYLENGYEIAGMSAECHYNVWSTIEEWHNGEMEHDIGMQKYLDYCKKNQITMQRLQKDGSYSGMDVMELYDRNLIPKNKQAKKKREMER